MILFGVAAGSEVLTAGSLRCDTDDSILRSWSFVDGDDDVCV